jgi:hypothetical protein
VLPFRFRNGRAIAKLIGFYTQTWRQRSGGSGQFKSIVAREPRRHAQQQSNGKTALDSLEYSASDVGTILQAHAGEIEID